MLPTMNFVGKTGHYTTGPTLFPVLLMLPDIAHLSTLIVKTVTEKSELFLDFYTTNICNSTYVLQIHFACSLHFAVTKYLSAYLYIGMLNVTIKRNKCFTSR